jgi:hypothetical protein
MLILSGCLIISKFKPLSSHQVDAIISQRELIFPIPLAIETLFSHKKM